VADGSVVPAKSGNAGGGKGLVQDRVSKVVTAERLAMSLLPLEEQVGKLWTALHTKAKAEPGYRFYALYDKLYRPDVLAWAYSAVRAHRGQREWTIRRSRTSRRMGQALAAGTDGGTPKQDVQPVRCGGYGFRRRTANSDRWAYRRSGTAWCKWRPCSCSKRSSRRTCSPSNTPTDLGRALWKRSRRSRGCWTRAIREVVDADLSGYFDSIPHHELMQCVARGSAIGICCGSSSCGWSAGRGNRRTRTAGANDAQQGRGARHTARRCRVTVVG